MRYMTLLSQNEGNIHYKTTEKKRRKEEKQEVEDVEVEETHNRRRGDEAPALS